LVTRSPADVMNKITQGKGEERKEKKRIETPITQALGLVFNGLAWNRGHLRADLYPQGWGRERRCANAPDVIRDNNRSPQAE